MHVTPHDVLVFDVGGTNLRAAIYCAATHTLRRTVRAPMDNHRTMPWASGEVIQKHLFEQMAAMSRQLLGHHLPERVAVAFPGPIDPAGRILAAPTHVVADGSCDCGQRCHSSWLSLSEPPG